MLQPLCLLALLLSLPLQGDGTPQHHHDEDDQGLLEARLFQVTAGGNIRGGKKAHVSNLSSDTDAQLSSTLEALFSSLTANQIFFAFIIRIKSKLNIAQDPSREPPWIWKGRAEFFQTIPSTNRRQIKRRKSTPQEDLSNILASSDFIHDGHLHIHFVL